MRPLVLALLVAVLAVPAGCGGGHRQQRGFLVYAQTTGRRDNLSWIWRAATDGTHRVRLLRGRLPLVSPDGRTLAFTRGVDRLEIATANGRRAHVVWRGSFAEPLAWSSDSRRLEFEGSAALFVLDTATGSLRRIARFGPTASLSAGSFSPDGTKLVYGRTSGRRGDLVLVDLRSSKQRRLTTDGRSFFPTWGTQRIAYLRGAAHGDVWVLRPGARPRRVTHGGRDVAPVAWTGDGRELLALDVVLVNGKLRLVGTRSGRVRSLGAVLPVGLSHDDRTLLALAGCGGDMLIRRGILETMALPDGTPHVVVRGTCAASWHA